MKTIVCLGDSITFGYDSHTKMSNYGQVKLPYPAKLQQLLGEDYNVINSGNTGWHAKTTWKHINELALDHKPDTVILMLGINDARGSRKELMRTKSNYTCYMQKIITELKLNNIRVILLSPTPVINWRVKHFNNIAIKIAKDNGIEYIDMHSQVYKKLNEDNLELTDILYDNVHLSDEYYEYIATTIYKKFDL